MDEKQFKELVEKVGQEAATKIKSEMEAAEKRINDNAAKVNQGMMTKSDFEKFKSEDLEKVNEQLKEIGKLEDAVKEIGKKLEANMEVQNAKGQRKSIEDFILAQEDKIKSMKESGSGCIVVTGAELKAAGITSISGSITDMDTPPGSPYAPGIGSGLELFDILRDPDFMLSRVDVGRTNQARLAWANEIDMQGEAALVDEGELKPLIQHIFKLETSSAKKIAGYTKITEEFEDDVPGLATAVRRMLSGDVYRAWDNAVQQAVIAIATAYNLGGQGVDDANYWDALRFMAAQVVVNNFKPNAIGINPITGAVLDTTKNVEGSYLMPTFGMDYRRMITEANKVANGYAFVGDLKQYKVDIYKDFSLRIGWVNDDLIRNQFCVVGELRYHNYISDARKKAIVYGNLGTIATSLESAASS